MKKKIPLLLSAALVLGGAFVPFVNSQPASAQPTSAEVGVHQTDRVELEDTFAGGYQGWEGMFADYMVDGDRMAYELDFSLRHLPQNLDATRQALYFAGHNRSDDLFMFATKELNSSNGIEPNTTYTIDLDFDIATKEAPGGAGSGGSPGESVYVKAGAVSVKPAVSLDASGKIYRANFDYGDQGESGKDAAVVGNLAKELSDDDSYEIKNFTNQSQPLYVKSDSAGRIWLIVGTDSGYEGLTQLYIPRIHATLTKTTVPSP